MKVSQLDKNNHKKIRDNVSSFIKSLSTNHDKSDNIVLDIAPQIHKGAAEHFSVASIETLDIDAKSKATYICDICTDNTKIIPSNKFDLVICTEVLEHTSNPFKAVDELYRIIKPGGTIAVSTPFNFRIHGPLPDNWRFTIHGLKELFKRFKKVEIKELKDDNRFLMPIHYTTIGTKIK